MSSQYNTPPVSQFPNLQYTPSSGDSQAYSTPDSSTPNTGSPAHLLAPAQPPSFLERSFLQLNWLDMFLDT